MSIRFDHVTVILFLCGFAGGASAGITVVSEIHESADSRSFRARVSFDIEKNLCAVLKEGIATGGVHPIMYEIPDGPRAQMRGIEEPISYGISMMLRTLMLCRTARRSESYDKVEITFSQFLEVAERWPIFVEALDQALKTPKTSDRQRATLENIHAWLGQPQKMAKQELASKLWNNPNQTTTDLIDVLPRILDGFLAIIEARQLGGQIFAPTDLRELINGFVLIDDMSALHRVVVDWRNAIFARNAVEAYRANPTIEWYILVGAHHASGLMTELNHLTDGSIAISRRDVSEWAIPATRFPEPSSGSENIRDEKTKPWPLKIEVRSGNRALTMQGPDVRTVLELDGPRAGIVQTFLGFQNDGAMGDRPPRSPLSRN